MTPYRVLKRAFSRISGWKSVGLLPELFAQRRIHSLHFTEGNQKSSQKEGKRTWRDSKQIEHPDEHPDEHQLLIPKFSSTFYLLILLK